MPVLVLTSLAVVMTWPLAVTSGGVPDFDDSYFSIWRLAWVAHQLGTHPTALFDANVFYPETNTLAYSDAMLLLGVAATPILWAGVPPEVVHNWLIIAAMAASASAMYMLARRLTGDSAAALLAAVVFAFAPFRFAHIGHLELQWTVWMPLSLWLIHELVERPRAATALCLGGVVAAQTLCSIYYGLFLSVYAAVVWCLLAATGRERIRIVRVTTVAILPFLVVASVYSTPYGRSRGAHGPRADAEVSLYSAVPRDYLRVPPLNELWSREETEPGFEERSLFPGIVALAFSVAVLVPPVSRMAWVYLLAGAVAFEGSLGTNGHVFPALRWLVPLIGSLRAPARFGVLVLLSVSVLAALGAARWNRVWSRRASKWIVVAAGLAICEYWSVVPLRGLPEPSPAHEWLATQPSESVVLELPVPTLDALWLHEATYEVRSITHWRRLVNGYSAFLPREYARTLELMRTFPDRPSIDRLHELAVDFVVLNRQYFEADDYSRIVSALLMSQDFGAPLAFGTTMRQVIVFPIRPRLAGASG